MLYGVLGTGVALGDSWISPEDFVFSWGPLLKDVSRIDNNGLNQSNSLALKIQQQLAEGKYEDATQTWRDLEDVILEHSNDVDFYNFMLDAGNGVPTSTTKKLKGVEKYLTYLRIKFSSTNGASAVDLDSFMNGPIREKLQTIPKNVTWGGQDGIVFDALVGDFMKPRIKEVDELLNKGVNVTIYNGQIDLICSTKGAEAWLDKLKWYDLQNYLSSPRAPLYCGRDETTTKGFMSSYKNLFFYWILGAGHFVPVDQPCVSLQMVGSITRSPSNSTY
ncbi:unnamed protein product [Ilex paraguariensis]|uniref:Serine carboxypeptidase n=1 Tax=Ilex paraguariensis TaxID=185542 RepID=A0ABC8UBV7_9AQUA